MDRFSSWCDLNKIKINETETVGGGKKKRSPQTNLEFEKKINFIKSSCKN